MNNGVSYKQHKGLIGTPVHAFDIFQLCANHLLSSNWLNNKPIRNRATNICTVRHFAHSPLVYYVAVHFNEPTLEL